MSTLGTRPVGKDIDGNSRTIEFRRHPKTPGLYQFLEPVRCSVATRCHVAFNAAGATFDAKDRVWTASGTQAQIALAALGEGFDIQKEIVVTPYGDAYVTPTRSGSVWVMHVHPRSKTDEFDKRVVSLHGDPTGSKGWYLAPEKWVELLGDQTGTSSATGSQQRIFRENNMGLSIAYLNDGRVDRDWHTHASRSRTVMLEGHQFDLMTIDGRMVARQRRAGGHELLRERLGWLPWQNRIDGCEITAEQANVFDGQEVVQTEKPTTSKQVVHEFETQPRLGTRMNIANRECEVVELVDPYIRKTDGLRSYLIKWDTTCMKCGQPARITTGRKITDFRPRCVEHGGERPHAQDGSLRGKNEGVNAGDANKQIILYHRTAPPLNEEVEERAIDDHYHGHDPVRFT